MGRQLKIRYTVRVEICCGTPHGDVAPVRRRIYRLGGRLRLQAAVIHVPSSWFKTPDSAQSETLVTINDTHLP